MKKLASKLKVGDMVKMPGDPIFRTVCKVEKPPQPAIVIVTLTTGTLALGYFDKVTVR